MACVMKTHCLQHQREAHYLPYRIAGGSMAFEDVRAWCKDVEQGMAQAGLLNPFSVYERLIAHVTANSRYAVRPLRDFRAALDDGKVGIYLRHDVDADVMAAIRAAELLQRCRARGSFYLLHTSAYYGVFVDNVFRRQPAIEEIVWRLSCTGQEIGLHIDPLHVYLNLGIDGTAAVRTEIAYLRRSGVDVVGVAAHNSAPVYGAENFEILKGLALGGRLEVEHNGRRAPLQTIDPARAGLTYEANFPGPPDPADRSLLASYLSELPADALRSRPYQEAYFLRNPVFSRPNQASAWLIGKDAWLFARHRPFKELRYPLCSQDLFSALDAMEEGARIIISVHPEYVGGGDAGESGEGAA